MPLLQVRSGSSETTALVLEFPYFPRVVARGKKINFTVTKHIYHFRKICPIFGPSLPLKALYHKGNCQKEALVSHCRHS